MNDPFGRLGYGIMRFRWLIFLFWLVLMPVAGGLGASKASGYLKGGGFVLPSSESGKAAAVLAKDFGGSNSNTAVVVFRSKTLTIDDAAFRDEVQASAKRLAVLEGVKSAVSYYDTLSPSLASADKHTALIVATLDEDENKAAKRIEPMREQLKGNTLESYVTGQPAIARDLEHTSEEDLKRSEFFTIPIVVLLLLLVFRTIVSSLIPLLLGACGVVAAIALIGVIGARTDLSIFALNTASMLGLGLGIDFSLIVVSRFRDELRAGKTTADALAITMATAGRSITYSGLTVIFAMLIPIFLLDLMIIRSMALAVLLVATTSLIGGLTLLPATLALLGRRVEWLPILPRPKVRANNTEGMWYRFSHLIMARPWIWLIVSLGLLVALAFPIKDIDVLGATAGVLPAEQDSVKGSKALEEAFGGNRLTPIQIVIQTGSDNGVFRPEALEAIAQLTSEIKKDPRVEEVASLTNLVPNLTLEQIRGLTPAFFTKDPALAGAAAQKVNLQGKNDITVLSVFVVAAHGQYDTEHQKLVNDLRSTIIPGVRQTRAYTVGVAGGSAEFLDLRDKVFGRFPYVFAGVMALTFIILMMFFQSVFLPLKAILMNLASILATYGVLVLIFQHGWGSSLLGFDPLGKLSITTPLILFVILLGLSTDYEVFMLSRVKEYYHETHNNEEAVAAGLESTARVITAAGLILIGTFGSFSLARVVTIKELGVGLAVGVLIDSTIVRIIMVPATMRLMGNLNWWMPAWLKKILPELKEGPAPSLAPAPALVPAMAGQPLGGISVAAPLPAQQGLRGPSPQLPPLNIPGAASQPQPVHTPAGSPQLPPLNVPAAVPQLPPLNMPGAVPQQAAAQAFPAQTASQPPQTHPSATPPPAELASIVGQLRSVGASVGTDVIVLPLSRPFRIGRDSQAELWLFDERISRMHARIDFITQPLGFVVTDLASQAGVYVNGHRITAPVLLRTGDRIDIGAFGGVSFVVELIQRPAAAAMSARG